MIVCLGGIALRLRGKNCVKCPPRAAPRITPRPREEKPDDEEYMEFELGSPPPTRGKDVCIRQRFHKPRITPAHAGKSQIVFL